MAVEGGLLGLLLFVGVGVAGLLTGISSWRLSRVDNEESSSQLVSRGMCWGLGSAALVATFSQAVSGFFDYGIAMPAAAALLTFVIASTAGCCDEFTSTASESGNGRFAVGRIVAVSVQMCLLGAALTYVPDQLAAAEIDKSVVVGTRLLQHEVTAEKLDRLKDEIQALESRLKSRPDDPEGLRILSRMLDAQFRWKVMVADNRDEVPDGVGFSMIWQKYRVMVFADRVADLARNDPATADAIRRSLLQLLQQTGLEKNLIRLQARFPLMPTISESLAEIAVLKADPDMFHQQVTHGLFVEPASATTHFRFGAMALEMNQKETAVELWKKSAQLSPVVRGLILNVARSHWTTDKAMELFGPVTYVECVVAAHDCRDGGIKNRLFDRAESIWKARPAVEEPHAVSLRAGHLVATRRPDAAIEFLREQIRRPGDQLSLRRQLARLYEGRSASDARAEWQTIQYLTGGDEEATAAIERLREKSR